MSRWTMLAMLALAAWIAMPDSADARSRHSRGLFGTLSGPFRLLLSPLRGRYAYGQRRAGKRVVARRPPAVSATTGLIAVPATRGAIAAPDTAGIIAAPAPAGPIAALPGAGERHAPPTRAAEATPNLFESILGYALWPRDYAAALWSHDDRAILNAMVKPSTDAPMPASGASVTVSGLCGPKTKADAGKPLDGIAQAVDLSEVQQSRLSELRAALAAAIDRGQAVCRNEVPRVHPERLAASTDGLWMLHDMTLAIRAPLSRFYDSLSAEQKGQFDDEPRTVGLASDKADPTPSCNRSQLQSDLLSNDDIERMLQPDDQQRATLQMLQGLSVEMGKFVDATCPRQMPPTPVARLDAAAERFNMMIYAAVNMAPALHAFYGQLSDAQRARLLAGGPR
jgi:hypothetical protein